MSTFKKHVGRIKNTDRRCVVVYMQIPENEENALIIDTDALPDRFHDSLMQVVDSIEGQQTQDLASLLARRVLPDLGLNILNALHSYGFLRPVPIDNVIMYPAPNAPCPLRTIVDMINGSTPKLEEKPVELENRILENQKADADGSQRAVAMNILRQAEDLEAEAAKKREQAYRAYPALRPASSEPVETSGETPPSPHVTEASASATEHPLSAPQMINEGLSDDQTIQDYQMASDLLEVEIDPDLPPEVAEALKASLKQGFLPEEETEPQVEGNQVDSSERAILDFLARVALREDRADKEKWEAMQPKNPVGRPRKDGLPAGTKPEPVAKTPKKRGRPPKVASE